MTTATAQKQIFEVAMFSPTMGARKWLVEAESAEGAMQKIACEKMQRDVKDAHEYITSTGGTEWQATIVGTKWTLYAKQAKIES